MKIFSLCGAGKLRVKEEEVFGISFLMTELPLSLLEAADYNTKDRIRILNAAWKRVEKTYLKAGEDLVRAVWYEPRLGELLGARNTEYPMEFLLAVYQSQGRKDRLILRDGGRAREFAWEVMEELNAMTVYTDNEEDWEEFAERAYEDSGLIVQYNQNLLKGARGNAVLMDFDERNFTDYRSLPERMLYIDLAPTKQKRRILQAKRKDIAYCDYAKILDTHKTSTI